MPTTITNGRTRVRTRRLHSSWRIVASAFTQGASRTRSWSSTGCSASRSRRFRLALVCQASLHSGCSTGDGHSCMPMCGAGHRAARDGSGACYLQAPGLPPGATLPEPTAPVALCCRALLEKCCRALLEKAGWCDSQEPLADDCARHGRLSCAAAPSPAFRCATSLPRCLTTISLVPFSHLAPLSCEALQLVLVDFFSDGLLKPD